MYWPSGSELSTFSARMMGLHVAWLGLALRGMAWLAMASLQAGAVHGGSSSRRQR